MEITHIEHLGIAVKSIESLSAVLRRNFRHEMLQHRSK